MMMANIKISKKTRELSQACNDFLNHYLIEWKRRENNTIQSYRDILRIYFQFLQTVKGIPIWKAISSDFNSNNIVEFLDWLRDSKNNSDSTLNKRLSEMKKFCEYLCIKELMTPHDFALVCDIEPVRLKTKQMNLELTMEQVQKILALPDINTRKGLRDCCLMTVLYDSGCRSNEIRSLKRQDIVFKGNVADITVLGKGNKFRTVPLSEQATRILKRYIRKENISDNDSYIFFVYYGGLKQKMSDDNIARILNKYEKIIKEDDENIPHLHPHLFRHTRSMHLYRSGVDLALISQWLGHANIETSLIYASADVDMKRKAIEKAMADGDCLYTNEEFRYTQEEIMEAMFGLSKKDSDK